MSHGPGFPSAPLGPGNPAGPGTAKHKSLPPCGPGGPLAPLLPVRSTKINKCASLCLCMSTQTLSLYVSFSSLIFTFLVTNLFLQSNLACQEILASQAILGCQDLLEHHYLRFLLETLDDLGVQDNRDRQHPERHRHNLIIHL